MSTLPLTLQSQDLVGIYSGFDQVFIAARPISATVREEAKVMEHPLEDGATITDHMVLQPVEIDLSLICPPDSYRALYQEMRDLYHAGAILSVQTRTETYDNMMITALPHQEDPDMYDALSLTVSLREVKIAIAEYSAAPPYKASSPRQSATVQRGEVQPGEEKGGDSWAYKVAGRKS